MLTSSWKWRAEAGEAEHRESDQGVWAVKAEGASGDHPDLGVDRFDAGVGEAVLDRGDDSGALLGDGLGQLDERREPTSPGPRDPLVEQRDRGGRRQPVDLAQLLLEQVAAIQRAVGLLDV
jgi:hypothetical protein